MLDYVLVSREYKNMRGKKEGRLVLKERLSKEEINDIITYLTFVVISCAGLDS